MVCECCADAFILAFLLKFYHETLPWTSSRLGELYARWQHLRAQRSTTEPRGDDVAALEENSANRRAARAYLQGHYTALRIEQHAASCRAALLSFYECVAWGFQGELHSAGRDCRSERQHHAKRPSLATQAPPRHG